MTREPLDEMTPLLAEVYDFYGTTWPNLYRHLLTGQAPRIDARAPASPQAGRSTPTPSTDTPKEE